MHDATLAEMSHVISLSCMSQYHHRPFPDEAICKSSAQSRVTLHRGIRVPHVMSGSHRRQLSRKEQVTHHFHAAFAEVHS